MAVVSKFGRVARRRRLELGLTQEELAEAADVDQSTISAYETGKTPRPARHLTPRIASALGVAPIDYLVLAEYVLPVERSDYEVTVAVRGQVPMTRWQWQANERIGPDVQLPQSVVGGRRGPLCAVVVADAGLPHRGIVQGTTVILEAVTEGTTGEVVLVQVGDAVQLSEYCGEGVVLGRAFYWFTVQAQG